MVRTWHNCLPCAALFLVVPAFLAGCSQRKEQTVSIVPDSAFSDPQLREAADMVLKRRPAQAIEAARRSAAGINAVGGEGDTLLLLAVGNDDVGSVQALLAAGADPNIPTTCAPLAVAAEKAGLPVVDALLHAHANPDGMAGTQPALWRAALFGRQDMVQLLSSAGAQLEKGNDRDETPLIAAVRGDQFQMALLLLELGASPFATSDEGYTAGYWITRSVIPATGVEGQARAQVIDRLKAAGFPWPPPKPAEVMAAKAHNTWPAH